MDYKLLDSPFLTATAVASAAVGTINGFTSLFDLVPFWADTVTTLVLLGTLIHWAVRVYACASEERSAPGRFAPELRLQAVRSISRIGLRSIYIPLILAVLLVWSASPLLKHLFRESGWALCTTIVTPCGSRQCLEFLDSRRRPVLPECTSTDDESGYKSWKPTGLTVYKPAFVLGTCGGDRKNAVPLPQSAFDGFCSGFVRVP
jgi:hypothetical protein